MAVRLTREEEKKTSLAFVCKINTLWNLQNMKDWLPLLLNGFYEATEWM